VKTNGKRACEVCGTALNENSEFCPVCALRDAVSPETESLSDITSELRFDHYRVLKNEDGTSMELGHGAMGVTYKAFDVHLQCTVALKIINARYIGDASARHRFVREARAAASVRHPNVASVLHLGESGGNYFYAMEFVDGETLENLIRKSGRLEIDLALEVAAQAAAGLTGIEKQHLVHRDIKPSNIMVSWEQRRLENVKIIDLGLAKGVAEQDTISVPGSFIGTPAYASPEQFAGVGTDIRSDLYSLGVTLWEMVSGSLPFQGSAAELMYQHQHAAPPVGELNNVPAPFVTLLQALLEKDPNQRFQSPAQLREALATVKTAIASNSLLTAKELRGGSNQITEQSSKPKSRKHAFRWRVVAVVSVIGLLLAMFFFYVYREVLSNQRSAETVATEKSIAVLPFESLSDNKNDSYFADGVQEDILASVSRISQIKVISRTSVMRYKPDSQRDLRQIAYALGVANILEGTVRRAANRVRITVELVDALKDRTIWAESYDRDLSDIFAIQSEVAQTVAGKLAATLSLSEKKGVQTKPTDNLEAYDLYLRAKDLIQHAIVGPVSTGSSDRPLREAIALLEQAVRLDPKFALAYCAAAKAHDYLYNGYDMTPRRQSLGDAAVQNALRSQPELPEAHLASAFHLYVAHRDYEQARSQLAIAMRGLQNSSEAYLLDAYMDRRQGDYEKAVPKLNEAISRDPLNVRAITELANTLFMMRQFSASEKVFDRAISIAPEAPMLRVLKAFFVTFLETGDDTEFNSALTQLPASMSEDRGALTWRLTSALFSKDRQQLAELIEKLNRGEDDGGWFFCFTPVPVGCYSILLARFHGQEPGPELTVARDQLNASVERSPANAKQLSNLAMIDAFLGRKENAIAEGKRALEMLPVSKDALDGPSVLANLIEVYVWIGESDLAFKQAEIAAKIPNGLFYGDLKLDPGWDPIRQDPRFEKLLSELAPRH
jgi:serine/threonine protein kinase/tetratricopeptide (TPR) repeat protein